MYLLRLFILTNNKNYFLGDLQKKSIIDSFTTGKAQVYKKMEASFEHFTMKVSKNLEHFKKQFSKYPYNFNTDGIIL